MKKIKYILGLVALVAFAAPASAQQTLEQATDSIRNILTDAKRGNAAAQNEVGGWYYRGQHTDQNYEEALQWWARAAKQGNTEAIGNMGLCYQTGHGIEQDSLKAVKLYQTSIKQGNKALLAQHIELAKKGNIFSDMLVASCYQNGIGVNKDMAKAAEYLKIAADNNCADAQRDLALIYLNDKRRTEAFEYFKKGMDNGDLCSTFYYGKMLNEGLGVKQNQKEGANYLLKAADGGFPQAMFYVGKLYMTGDGLTKNAEQAIKWYKMAAGKNVAGAQWELAKCYREGIGTPVNYDMAMNYYAAAVAKGYTKPFKALVTDSIPDSPFVSYLKGMKAYASKDYEAALGEFKKVEKAKIIDGKVMTGAILINSAYPKNNVKKGIKLLQEAAKNNNPQALYLLATLYEAGKGVPQNMQEAVNYLRKSADMGYGPAQSAFGDLYFEGRGVDQNYFQASQWYEKAYDQGLLSENAAKRYASIYEDGKLGIDPDEEKAKEILDSVRTGEIPALLKLL